MLLTSTYAPSTTITDLPVLIVCHGPRRIFMLKTHTYSEMIVNVRQKLAIDAAYNVSLETTALDVCRGCKVEIDEDVWPVIRPSLDEVTVIVSGSESDVEDVGMLPSEAYAPDSLAMESADEERKREVEAERVDGWLEGQSEAFHEMGDRPSSACSQNEVNEDLLRRDGEDEDHPEENSQVLETEPVRPINRNRVRFETEDPQAMRDAEEPLPVEQEDPLEQRFQVRVIGPQPDQNAEIKTRGKHLVKKVLAAVCKTFSIDYDGAVLYLISHAKDDQGRSRQHCFRCPPNWSMARCGVTSETELRIRIEVPQEAAPTVTQRSK